MIKILKKNFKDEMSITDFSFCFRVRGGWAVVLCPNKAHFTCYKPSFPLVVGQVQGGDRDSEPKVYLLSIRDSVRWVFCHHSHVTRCPSERLSHWSTHRTGRGWV